MTDTRPDKTLWDTLDREIAGLLAVDPSPEFVAKVRERVAGEPEPGMWRFGWVAAGAAAVAVLALAVVASRPPLPPGDADQRVPTVARAVGIGPLVYKSINSCIAFNVQHLRCFFKRSLYLACNIIIISSIFGKSGGRDILPFAS